jgi:hypothetical protein
VNTFAVSAPVLVAAMGPPRPVVLRRADLAGQRDRRDRPQGPADEQSRAIPAAIDTRPRRQDPQLARIYYLQITERGATHLKACCVAGHLAERALTVLHRATPYVNCDNNSNPVTPERAKKIIADKWTGPEDVRKRQRSRKLAGKAPQAARNRAGQARRPSGVPF